MMPLFLLVLVYGPDDSDRNHTDTNDSDTDHAERRRSNKRQTVDELDMMEDPFWQSMQLPKPMDSLHSKSNLTNKDASNGQSQLKFTAQQRQEIMQQFAEYNESCFFGSSLSCLMYFLSVTMKRECLSFLWDAAIGLTDGFLSGRLDASQYGSEVDALRREVARLCGDSQTGSAHSLDQASMHGRNSSSENQINSFSSTDPSSADRNSHGSAISGMTNQPGTIYCTDDLRLMLHRHWTLLDSLSCTPSLYSKLSLWRSDKGRANLDYLLVKMAMPVRHCRQDWAHVPIELKRSLSSQLARWQDEFGLGSLSFSSFGRLYRAGSSSNNANKGHNPGNQSYFAESMDGSGQYLAGSGSTGACIASGDVLTCSDMVYGMQALLSAPSPPNSSNRHSNNKHFLLNSNQNTTSASAQVPVWVLNFHSAFGLLDSSKHRNSIAPTQLTHIKQAIRLAIGLQHSLVSLVSTVLSRQLLKNMQAFRLLYLKEDGLIGAVLGAAAATSSASGAVASSHGSTSSGSNTNSSNALSSSSSSQVAMLDPTASIESLRNLALLVIESLVAEGKSLLPLVIAVHAHGRLCGHAYHSNSNNSNNSNNNTDNPLDRREGNENTSSDNDYLVMAVERYNGKPSIIQERIRVIAEDLELTVEMDTFEGAVVRLPYDQVASFASRLKASMLQ